MSMCIAFVGTLKDEEENEWLRALRNRMPHENLISLREMTPTQAAHADIAIVANPRPADVRQLPKIRWIQSLWAGVEQLVDDFKFEIPVVRLIDPELARTMAESTLAWTYFLTRNMHAYASFQRLHKWRPLRYRHPANTTVGILGLGLLGMAAANVLVQAGFRVLGWCASPKPGTKFKVYCGSHEFRSVLERSDILICLLPLTAQTRGLLNSAAFDLMQSGAALINFGRGPIVVTDELVSALNQGRLRHAILDVFDTEPLPETSLLWDHPNITVLPHISAPTNVNTASAIVADNILQYRRTGMTPPAISSMRGY